MSNAWTVQIRHKLQSHRLHSKQLASIVGISPQYMSNILSGYYEASQEVAERIGRFFGISLDLWFIRQGRIPEDILSTYPPETIAAVFQQMREEP